MTDKSTLSAVYSYEDKNLSNQGVGGFNLPEVVTKFKNREDLLRFNHNWIISPKLVYQISALFGRYDTPIVSLNQARRIVVQDRFSLSRLLFSFTPRRSYGELYLSLHRAAWGAACRHARASQPADQHSPWRFNDLGGWKTIDRLANAPKVWGDLFNRPACGLVLSGVQLEKRRK